ncbi:hypothetical protein HPB50_000448 [Hyalomma asiaticum]|uniref:Uncharacterized protein n=1 Tax=Hyalomma asiaticum TaxID=266040 RepID=A0ACB7TCZ4_HYAAI|nr:hypothetical protein HPB50_000448 [Hyalomma asiaticum]
MCMARRWENVAVCECARNTGGSDITCEGGVSATVTIKRRGTQLAAAVVTSSSPSQTSASGAVSLRVAWVRHALFVLPSPEEQAAHDDRQDTDDDCEDCHDLCEAVNSIVGGDMEDNFESFAKADADVPVVAPATDA